LPSGKTTPLHERNPSSNTQNWTLEAQLWAAADQAALEFSHGPEDAQLKPSCWIVAAGVNALGGADERDAKPLQLVEDQG
jgi:hypothetical protein